MPNRPIDFTDEIRSYIEHETQLNLERGMSPEAARAAACRRFGNRGSIEEQIFFQQRPVLLDSILQDIRYALRNLRRSPQFAALAILSLTLGIAVNTAMFSVICAAVYPHWPYRDYLEIYRVQSERPNRGGLGNLGAADLGAIRKARAFREIAAQESVSFNSAAPGAPVERLNGLRATPNLFRFLGVGIASGRDFRDDEGLAGAPPVAIIGYGYWERRFAKSPDALGQTLRLNGESYTIIGVLPPWFHWLHWRNTGCGDPASEASRCLDIYLPGSFEAAAGPRNLMVLGNLAPGVTKDRAGAEIGAIAAGLSSSHSDTHKDWGARVQTLDRSLHSLQPGFIVMQAAVSFVLLIACANVANLLLARSAARSREMAVRSAIGASRGRLVRQLLTEGAILSILASAAGMGLAVYGARLLADSARLPLLDGVLDRRVLAFTMALSIVTCILFALAPSLQAGRWGAANALRLAGRGASAGRFGSRARSSLVAAEMCLSLVLLISAGLMMRSVSAQLEIPLGFDARDLVLARVELNGAKYADPRPRAAALEQLLSRVAALPGIRSAALATGAPLSSGDTVAAALPGDDRSASDLPKVRFRAASRDYFRVLGVGLERGRDFSPTDSGRAVAIVNRSMAAAFWPGQDPIGRQVKLFSGRTPHLTEVIGVIPDVKDRSIREAAHAEVVELVDGTPGTPWILARTRSSPQAFLASLRTVLAGVDPETPVASVQTMEAARNDQFLEVAVSLQWLGVFSAIALAMAGVGVYGVIAYAVAQRRQEIGIRMALGAGAHRIALLVLTQTARLAAAGIVSGTVLAAFATRALEAALFGVSAVDPPTFATAAAILLAIALGAAIAPLRMSLSVDPAESLRAE